jgi:hypothetical protein
MLFEISELRGLARRSQVEAPLPTSEAMLESAYATYCQTLCSLRKSGEWKAWHEDWSEYCKQRWGLSKSRAKALAHFAKFRDMCEAELFGTLPETPEQVKPIMALPQKKWLETWEMVLGVCKFPITPQNVESALQHFGIYANKRLSPEARKAIRLRRAAKTMAEAGEGSAVVSQIGGRALGKRWDAAVKFVIDADQERMNQMSSK